ncbi:MAG: MerR family transcriptional regulator [Tatlockia sp.]|nr:MerR family transcriptional regulator [Tatlockia sp.]
MTKDKKDPVALECEEWFYLSLTEVSSSFGVSSETVLAIIDEGIITIQKDDKNQLCFTNEAMRDIRTVLRLTKDLGVNLAGAGLALELLEEINNLRSKL